MAGEMMYILEQRLKIQPNVTEVRSTKVLQDIMGQVLKDKTLQEIFKSDEYLTFRPQEIPSRRYLRVLFEKLAHSSIMRLNETSMDKLFDLMLMMTKYQIQSVVMPEQVGKKLSDVEKDLRIFVNIEKNKSLKLKKNEKMRKESKQQIVAGINSDNKPLKWTTTDYSEKRKFAGDDKNRPRNGW
uniref:PCI domain-containing protein n=1 Tax=Heterorhabditis bacteriophora TaxID=37862 RepID=A0A1I7WFA9_HETBA